MDKHDPRDRGIKREKDKATKTFYTNVVSSKIMFQLKKDTERDIF